MALRAAVAVAGVAAASGLAACGTSPSMTPAAGRELSAAVQAVRSAALAHSPSQAAADLASLQAEVTSLEKAGELSSTRAKAILAAAGNVKMALALIVTTTTTTTTTFPAPYPPGGPPGPGDNQKGESKGPPRKGKGDH